MSWIGDMIKGGLDGVKKDASYEVRRMGRKTVGKYFSNLKQKAAAKAKVRVDAYLEKHPSRIKAQEAEKNQVEKVAKKVQKDMQEEVKATPVAPVPVKDEDEIRQIEF